MQIEEGDTNAMLHFSFTRIVQIRPPPRARMDGAVALPCLALHVPVAILASAK